MQALPVRRRRLQRRRHGAQLSGAGCAGDRGRARGRALRCGRVAGGVWGCWGEFEGEVERTFCKRGNGELGGD